MRYTADISYYYPDHDRADVKLSATNYADLITKVRDYLGGYDWEANAVYCNENSQFSNKALSMFEYDVNYV